MSGIVISMNRLEIILLDRANGVITGEYIDVQSVLMFFKRSLGVRKLQIVARKGEKALFIDKIDPTTVVKKLNDFAMES
jgi:hypothetical protein